MPPTKGVTVPVILVTSNRYLSEFQCAVFISPDLDSIHVLLTSPKVAKFIEIHGVELIGKDFLDFSRACISNGISFEKSSMDTGVGVCVCFAGADPRARAARRAQPSALAWARSIARLDRILH